MSSPKRFKYNIFKSLWSTHFYCWVHRYDLLVISPTMIWFFNRIYESGNKMTWWYPYWPKTKKAAAHVILHCTTAVAVITRSNRYLILQLVHLQHESLRAIKIRVSWNCYLNSSFKPITSRKKIGTENYLVFQFISSYQYDDTYM